MRSIKSILATSLLALSLHAPAADTVDINAADAATLASEIIGIGPARAAAIVDYRETHGPFKSVDDLVLVKGIGMSTVDKNRTRLSVAVDAEN